MASSSPQPPPLRVCEVCGQTSAQKICPNCGTSAAFVGWFTRKVKDKITIILLWLALIFAWIELFVLMKVVPTFADVFASFGAKLPGPTVIWIQMSNGVKLFNSPFLMWIPFGALYLLIVFLFERLRIFGLKTAVGLFVFSILFIFFTIISLFMPMFEIGNVVN